jgi:hypothetical protein
LAPVGPHIRSGVSASPALDTLLEAAPIAFKGRLVQCILRLHPGRPPQIHDSHDQQTGALAAWLAKRAPAYISLGFPAPAAWLLKQAPAARKGPARTPDARAAITLQPPSPRL